MGVAAAVGALAAGLRTLRPTERAPACENTLRHPIMTVEINEQNEAPGHEHKDVSGGWLRPAVFGAMDGLVTNVSLIAGVGAGVSASGASPHFIVLTGLAGLAAGAFSMATGEYVSVSSQNELIQAEVRKEAHELKYNAESERM